jgi:phosphatidylserine/phosphatidylglycerophosphate/cardiolipin synthase-like enzyme
MEPEPLKAAPGHDGVARVEVACGSSSRGPAAAPRPPDGGSMDRPPRPAERSGRRWLSAATIALTAFGSAAPAGDPGRAAPPAAILFSPGDGPGTLQAAIVRALRGARASIDIAVYTGMTAGIAEEVARASSRCAVRVIVDWDALTGIIPREKDEETQGRRRAGAPRWREILGAAGVPVRVLPAVRPRGADRPIFHHKFAVIDGATLIAGSYNWSARGDGTHYDTVLVIADAGMAARFGAEFARLWSPAREAPAPIPRPRDRPKARRRMPP